jgi:hypothetical protein
MAYFHSRCLIACRGHDPLLSPNQEKGFDSEENKDVWRPPEDCSAWLALFPWDSLMPLLSNNERAAFVCVAASTRPFLRATLIGLRQVDLLDPRAELGHLSAPGE